MALSPDKIKELRAQYGVKSIADHKRVKEFIDATGGNKPNIPVGTGIVPPTLDMNLIKQRIAAGRQAIPEPAKIEEKPTFDTSISKESIKERFGDVYETAKNVLNEVPEAYNRIKNIATDENLNPVQKLAGVLVTGIGGAVTRGIGDIAIGAGKLALTQDAEDSLKATVEDIARGVSDTEAFGAVKNWYDNLSDNNKFVVKTGLELLDLTTIGVAETGLTPALKKLGRVIGETADVVKPAVRATGEVAEEAITTAVKPVVKGATFVKETSKGLSESLVAGINRINPSKLREFESMTGTTVGKWLTDRGVVGTRQKTIKTLVDNFNKLRKNVDEAIENIPGTHKDSRITVVADESADFAKGIESPEAARMAKLAEKSEGVGLTAKEINEVKRFYERNIKVGYMKDPTKTAESVARATNRDSGIREALMDIADEAGFDNLRQMNKEIQANKLLADEIAGKMVGQEANNIMGITDWIVATPGIAVDPKFLAGFVAKKFFSTETVRAAAAKVLAGFPKRVPVLEADLNRIKENAKAFLEREATEKIKQTEMAILSDELQKSGLIGGEGFVMQNKLADIIDAPITKEERALIRAAKNKAEQEEMVMYIIEQRAAGNAVGEGFVVKGIENTPLLNPKNIETPEKAIEF
jgi:hypothetical protein